MWVKIPLGEVGCKNRRRTKLVLNLMQWRVLIALNMHVLYVDVRYFDFAICQYLCCLQHDFSTSWSPVELHCHTDFL